MKNCESKENKPEHIDIEELKKIDVREEDLFFRLSRVTDKSEDRDE